MTIEYVTSSIPLDSLRPFAENSKIFSDSLSPASISALADDIYAHGLSQPILTADVPRGDGIGTDLTVVDGHRRERAFRVLRERHPGDTRYQSIPHRHLGSMTRDQVLARIIDCFASARRKSPPEMAAVYMAAKDLLTRTRGRPVGRPSKNNLPGDYLSAEDIQDEAAKKAGVSVSHAQRLEAIFTNGAEDLQQRVTSGELSVKEAYGLIPKRAKAKVANVAENPFAPEEENSQSSEPGPSESPSDEPFAPKPPSGDPENETTSEGQPDAPVVSRGTVLTDTSDSAPLTEHRDPTRTSGGRTPGITSAPSTLAELVALLVTAIDGSEFGAGDVVAALATHYSEFGIEPPLDPTESILRMMDRAEMLPTFVLNKIANHYYGKSVVLVDLEEEDTSEEIEEDSTPLTVPPPKSERARKTA